MSIRKSIRRVHFNQDNIISLLLIITPIVDAINGMLLEGGYGSIASVYKILLCGVLLFFVIKKGKVGKNTTIFSLCAIVWVLVSAAIGGIVSHDPYRNDFVYKLVFNIIFLAVLTTACKRKCISSTVIFKAFSIGAWVFIACFVIPYVLGIGTSTYTGNLGYKGFFFSQNEIGFVLITFFYFVLYNITYKYSILQIIKLGLLFFCGMLLNTKACLISCIIGTAFLILMIVFRRDFKHRALFLGAVIGSVVLLRKTIVRSIMVFLVRFNSLNESYGGSVSSTLVSGRNYKLHKAIESLEGENAVIKFVFGNGFHTTNIVEMDFIDVFFCLGVVGLIFTLVVMSKIVVEAWKNIKQDKTKIRYLELAIVLFFMFFSGHVLFMGTSGVYFALAVCFMIYYSDIDIRNHYG